MQIQIIDTKISHIRALRNNLRHNDRLELERFGITEKEALHVGYKKSIYCKTALVNGEVAACWGVYGGLLSITGIVWLLTSDVCEQVTPITFAKIYRNEVKNMLNLYPILENIVDANYHKSVRMLQLAGFMLEEPKPIGSNGAMYRKFRIEA